MRASGSLLKETVGSSPATGIFLYVAPAVERVLAVAFRKKNMVVQVPLTAYFFM